MTKIKSNDKVSFSMALLLLGVFSCNSVTDMKVDLKLEISKDRVGIGLIHFNLNKPIPFFATVSDNIAYDTLQFSEKKGGLDKGICIFKTSILGKTLIPYILSVGDSEQEGAGHINTGLISFSPELVFRVLKKFEDKLTVMINEETGETSIIKIDSANDYRTNSYGDAQFFDPNFIETKNPNWFYYETWEQAINRAFVIRIDDQAKIYDVPDGMITKNNKPDFFRVDSIKNEWARLTNRDYYSKSEKIIYGWVKWKENDSMKIEISLNGGYD